MPGGSLKAKIIGATVAALTIVAYIAMLFSPDPQAATTVVLGMLGSLLALWLAWRLITRVRIANLWSVAQARRQAGDWSGALDSVDRILKIAPSQGEMQVVRLVLLLNLQRDEEILQQVLGVRASIYGLHEGPRQDFLDSYARMMGGAAFAQLHGPDVELPSQHWYDPAALANPAVPGFTRRALPDLPAGIVVNDDPFEDDYD